MSTQFETLSVSHTGRYGHADAFVAHVEYLFMRFSHIAQSKVQLGLIVFAMRRLMPCSTVVGTTEKLFEEITETSSITLGAGEVAKSSKVESSETTSCKVVKTTLLPLLLLILATLCLILIGMCPVLAIFVILLTFFRVA